MQKGILGSLFLLAIPEIEKSSLKQKIEQEQDLMLYTYRGKEWEPYPMLSLYPE